MEYYSTTERNAFESVLMRWMNLEPVMQCEVSQKEKDKHHMQMDPRKMVLMNLSAGQQWRCKQDRLVDAEGRSGWDELREQH